MSSVLGENGSKEQNFILIRLLCLACPHRMKSLGKFLLFLSFTAQVKTQIQLCKGGRGGEVVEIRKISLSLCTKKGYEMFGTTGSLDHLKRQDHADCPMCVTQRTSIFLRPRPNQNNRNTCTPPIQISMGCIKMTSICR